MNPPVFGPESYVFGEWLSFDVSLEDGVGVNLVRALYGCCCLFR